ASLSSPAPSGTHAGGVADTRRPAPLEGRRRAGAFAIARTGRRGAGRCAQWPGAPGCRRPIQRARRAEVRQNSLPGTRHAVFRVVLSYFSDGRGSAGEVLGGLLSHVEERLVRRQGGLELLDLLVVAGGA